MSKFIVIYHARAPYMQMMQEMGATREDMQGQMQAWMEWAGRCGNGLPEMGGPMVGNLKLTNEGSSPSDKNVVGYSILEAGGHAGGASHAGRPSPPGAGPQL